MVLIDDDEIMICAFRYCLGRQTYVVSNCCRWLRERWDKLDPNTRAIIRADLLNAIYRDKEYRERNNGENSQHLGGEMDVFQWQDLNRWIMERS